MLRAVPWLLSVGENCSVAVLTVPLALTARAFREVLARPLRSAVVTAGLTEGGMCAILWASYSQQGL